jgi:nucleotide-binding universal stress UspA family protein
MHIAHAAASSDSDDPGFVHAVALAAHGGARLTSVHVREPGAPPLDLPEASVLLRRWRMAEDRVAHERVQCAAGDSTDESLLETFGQLQPDLVVLSTHARGGLLRVLVGSVAESVARNLDVPVLLLPYGGAGFADPQTGALRLSRVLVPAGSSAHAERAARAAASLVALAGGAGGELVLLHVGDRPAPSLPAPAGFRVSRERADGDIVAAIVSAADAARPDLVAMVTSGHDSVADVLLASHTERVLHRCRRPLLWVPVPPAA